MNFNFSEKVNNFLKIILKNALKSNKRVFFVGGIVRDRILNVEIKDIDLLLLGNAIEFARNLPDEVKLKSIHEDFCTAKVQYEDLEIDIASSRLENYPHSGCLPVVDTVGVDLDKDVLRRDFSINSMYCELKLVNNEIKYEFIDIVNGLEDLKNKTLKVLHNKSYVDDPTRILRGVGFKYRFGFDFSNYDKKLINEYLSDIQYDFMSSDRNLKVFKYIFSNDFQDEIFREIVEKKYYKLINKNDLNINLSRVFEICEKFNLDKNQKADFFVEVLINKGVDLFQNKVLLDIYKNFSKFTSLQLAYYFYKTNSDDILEYLKIKDIELKISGDDLIKLGFKQGKIIGEILDDLMQEKLNSPDKFQNKEAEILWIKNSRLI